MKKIILLITMSAMMLASASFADNTATINGPDNDDTNAIEVQKTQDANYYRYENAQFQYAIDIPVKATQASETSNGDGCMFVDPVDNATYTVYGAKNMMNLSLSNLYNIDMGTINFPKLTMQNFGENWYVIAWEKDKMGYYKKMYLNKDTYTSFGISYPLDKKKKYEKIIAHIDKSFVSTGVQVSASK